ncbi:hypothetical protein [Arthrobacter sp.]|uniref:hypothetical protein n=1 Tax=Arthrobacter sp. TaxID=1667 RepID=UPI0026E0B4D4|nr:hypothetical protein [Arthrobacter sp.]MDO5753723.1 hypothetical protein [Arthrobacter sp.]
MVVSFRERKARGAYRPLLFDPFTGLRGNGATSLNHDNSPNRGNSNIFDTKFFKFFTKVYFS